MWLDYLIAGGILIAGMTGLVIVAAARKRFRLWTAVPACLACVVKGVRGLYYLATVRQLKGLDDIEQMMRVMQRTQTVTVLLDACVISLLITAIFCLWHGNRWKRR